MDVIILCGGKGSRLSEETILKPKPMVEIGGKPILWHIMKYYSYYGFKNFILALGYKGNCIKEYFYNLRITGGDFKIKLNPSEQPTFFNPSDESEWEITFVDTGEDNLKGSRIKQLESYINTENFHLTYGDGLCNVNLLELLQFHKLHKKIGTVTAVRPPSRFGEIMITDNYVTNFDEKAQMGTGYINGGFFVFKHDIFNYLTLDENCDFEFGPINQLVRDKELMAFKHSDFWQCMDNVRDRDYLNSLLAKNQAPWKVW